MNDDRNTKEMAEVRRIQKIFSAFARSYSPIE